MKVHGRLSINMTQQSRGMRKMNEAAVTGIINAICAIGMIVAVYKIGGGWWALFTGCVWILIPKALWK